jgi:hypothetical protein
MNISVYVTGAIMIAFMAVATGWSLTQTVKSNGIWRLVHLMLALSMLGGALAIYMNQGSIGMLLGIVLLILSLAVMFISKLKKHWLIVIQFISGALLASGIPFGAP